MTTGTGDATGETAAEAPVSAPRLAVMLHGAFLNPEVWHGYADLLGDGFRVIAPSYARESLVEAVDAIATEIEAAGGHALVVGHSLGGYTALALAASRPGLVDGVVLVDASTPPRGFATLLALHLVALERLPESVTEPALGMMINRRDAVTWQRVRDSGLSMRRGARAVRALRRFDYWTAVRSIRCPILLINGGHDWLFRSGEGGTVLAARDARLAVLPGAGHLAPLHRRAEVSVLIRGFAARIDGPKADRPARSPRAGVRRQPRG